MAIEIVFWYLKKVQEHYFVDIGQVRNIHAI